MNYKIPKGIMKTKFEPRLPRMSWKNIKFQVFCPWTIKAIYYLILVPFRTTKACHSCRFGRFVPSTGVFKSGALWGLYVTGFDGPMSKYFPLMQWSWVRILDVKFIIFSCQHPWETRFKSGFHSSFWDFISGIWNWGMASSFWNHVIQISIG